MNRRIWATMSFLIILAIGISLWYAKSDSATISDANIVVTSVSTASTSGEDSGASEAVATDRPPDPWATLTNRSVVLPDLGADGTCPVTPYVLVAPNVFGGFSAEKVVVSIEGTARSRNVVAIPAPWDFATRGPLELKTQWYVSLDYDGPLLIRGRQIGGDNVLTFTGATTPAGTDSVARLTPEASIVYPDAPQWRNWLVLTRVPDTDCYVYQVDGLNFSASIVFEVVADTP